MAYSPKPKAYGFLLHQPSAISHQRASFFFLQN